MNEGAPQRAPLFFPFNPVCLPFDGSLSPLPHLCGSIIRSMSTAAGATSTESPKASRPVKALPVKNPRVRRMKAAARKVRELAIVGRALASTGHPVMAQIVPMRFCNLSCGYCNEYDKVSKPVPIDEMERRIDHLGRLGTSIITISGGEPLTHPESRYQSKSACGPARPCSASRSAPHSADSHS